MLSRRFKSIGQSIIGRLLENCLIEVCLLYLYWYRTQTFCIKWGSTTSDFVNVSNGVRQSGILSPCLFIVYIDELSNMLNSAGIGCHMPSALLIVMMLSHLL